MIEKIDCSHGDWLVAVPTFLDPNYLMIDSMFWEVGFFLPLINFDQKTLTYLKMAQSHLYSKCWAFIMVFQLVCSYLKHETSIKGFFFIFSLAWDNSKIPLA